MEESTVFEKYRRTNSTDQAWQIFQRFIEEIPKIGNIELKPFDTYPSFYAESILVGVQLLKEQVKLHLTMEDARKGYSFEELKNSIQPHKEREEWAYIYIKREPQVKAALNVIRKAYSNRRLVSI